MITPSLEQRIAELEIYERNVVTTTDNSLVDELTEVDPGSNGTAESTEVGGEETSNTRYLDLVKATWLLAYDLSSWGDQDLFCVDGTNEWLRAFGLPELVETDGNAEIAENYVTAWFNWQNWNVASELTEADDRAWYEALARRIRTKLLRDEPKPRDTMNGWLAQLGLETLDVRVSYVGRIA